MKKCILLAMTFITVLATEAALAETEAPPLKGFSCRFGRSTLAISELDETGKASVYMELISTTYLETYFNGQIVDGGRFIKVNLDGTKGGFILIDTALTAGSTMKADLIWEGLDKETIVGRKTFACRK